MKHCKWTYNKEASAINENEMLIKIPIKLRKWGGNMKGNCKSLNLMCSVGKPFSCYEKKGFVHRT